MRADWAVVSTLAGAALFLLGGCSEEPTGGPVTPAGWRTVTFDRCCEIALPPDYREVPKPAGVVDPTFTTFGDGSSEITFEYRPQVGFPEGPLGQTGWSKETLAVDGRNADLVRHDAQDAFAGGKTLRLRVRLPDEPTFQSEPAAAAGMELGATGHCRNANSCAIIERIYRSVDLPPLRRAD